jgi:carbamoyltransferase
MNILGISYNYHDAAACLIRDGQPLAAAEEERFSRRKHDARFPRHAIAYCLQEAGIRAADLDAIAFYEKPARKLARVLQIGRQYAPASNTNVVTQFSHVINTGINVEQAIRRKLQFDGRFLFCEHHLAHAASAFFVSPFKEAAILTIDGVGEWSTCAEFDGCDNSIEVYREIHYPHSLGLLYSTITSYLGFKVNDDEYKVMGLASYGKPRFRNEVEKLVRIESDGSFTLTLSYFAFMFDRHKMYTEKLEELLGPARFSKETITDRHRDIAASIQQVTEDILVEMARSCRERTAQRNLCLAGGVAQNCVANSRILDRSGFENVFVQPAPGDSGAAMGAALWASHQILHETRQIGEHHTLLGPAFSEEDIAQSLERFGMNYVRLDEEQLCTRVASMISQNFVIGWFQGRMEFGPRALGSRSILANPCSPDMKDILNARVKFREEFRPFAPAVTEEAASNYFELSGRSPFMLFTPKVRPEHAGAIPSVTHIDGTARVQTVSKIGHPLFHRLIESFAKISGTPVLINTSFNVRGEPIVCTPDDAINCFLATDIDFLAIGPFLVTKALPCKTMTSRTTGEKEP